MSEFHKYRSIYSHDELMARLRKIKHVALDMDGTIYMGMSLFPYTKPFLAGLTSLGVNYSFLTNNPSKCIADYLHKLDTLGIKATEEEMYTTALATIDYIKTNYPKAKRLFLLGTPSMISEFEKAGFVSTADDPDDVPDVIVAAFDMTLVYNRLCRAAWWISQGIPYIATNPDRVCPTDKIVGLGQHLHARRGQLRILKRRARQCALQPLRVFPGGFRLLGQCSRRDEQQRQQSGQPSLHVLSSSEWNFLPLDEESIKQVHSIA